MERIYKWKASRSGAGLKISGQTRSGTPVHITGVLEITGDRNGCIARTNTGATYSLGGEIVGAADLKYEGGPKVPA